MDSRCSRRFTPNTYRAFSSIPAASEQWNFAPTVARIEEVRSSVDRLGCAASEDVLGKATDWNTEIQAARLWNSRWLADPFYHDGWDTVATIIIPDCRGNAK